MYPIYGHMDSCPCQRPYAPDSPNLESIPYQMKPDIAKSPSPYEYGPYGNNNYYHPHPLEFHGCCNHNYFPSCYTFHPPYPHFPPPPPQPFHCHGGYASHPHYPVEMPPRYEYDKNIPRDHHCCGCPNHSCTRKDDQIVKVEEPDPDGEKKTGDALVPHQFKNYPYPVVWIPPGYLKCKEQGKGKPVEEEPKGKERNENLKSFEEEPRFLNGWLPLDMNKVGTLMQGGGDGRKVQNQKNDEEGRFPFSIFRVPYKPEELERNGPKENKLPSHFSITPVDASDTEDSTSKNLLRGSEEDSDSVPKIPQKVEKKTEKEPERKAKNIPVEFRTDNGEGKITKNTEKRRSSSSSPPKSSKLPPVCLRVDPLPGKKSSSRSPSPANKRKSEKSTSENPKISALPSNKENCQEKTQPSNLVEKSKETKVIEVVGNDSKNIKCGAEEVVEAKNVIFGQSDDGKCEAGEGKGESELIKETADDEAKKAERKFLSDDEASVIIQSAYRGYEVRRWEPLIKLKQIAKVKDQAAEVKRSIEALKSSSTDVRSDDKQRLVIGETIMSLLLKLDAIQGLHPSIRDIRKSVARELVNLQEKLDALTTKNPIEDHSTTATAGDLENKMTESPVANEETNVEEQKDKVLDIENSEDLELKPSDEVLSVSAEQMGEFEREAEEENDEKVLEKAQGEEINHANEPGVVEDTNGKAEESPVQPFGDEAMKADDVGLAFKAEPPKPEIPIVKEENDEKVLEEARLGAEVQPEEAQQEVFGHTEENTGKKELFAVQPLEDEVPHDNDKVQPIEAEEVLDHTEEPVVVVDEISGKTDEVQTVEADVPVVVVDEITGKNVEVQAIAAEEHAVVVDEITGKSDKVQAVEAEEPVVVVDKIIGKTDEVQAVEAEEPAVLVDEIIGKTNGVQAIEAEEPQMTLPFVESELLRQELIEANDEFSGQSDAILVEEEKAVVDGDKELVADYIIEQPNRDTEEFVPRESEEKLREENEKLKEMVEKLVEAGKEQLSAISSLSGKVKDLERKLSEKKKLKMRKCAKKSRTFDDQIQMVC